MKHRFLIILSLIMGVGSQAWAQTKVATDSELRDAITNGADIVVTADIMLSNSTLSIPEGATVTIDLGGHTLDRQLPWRGDGGGQVITVRSGATLNLSNGTLKGGWGGNAGGLSNESGRVNLTNVNITSCSGDDAGGGICNLGGTLTMTGGSITNNTCYDHGDPAGGGGLFNAEGATATLTNVTITGNKDMVCGGGGICNYGTILLDGCTITGNKARTVGGGIWNGNEKRPFKMQGANIITDNFASDIPSNLYMRPFLVITLTGSMAGSRIGITLEMLPNMFTDGFPTYHSVEELNTIFTADRPEINEIVPSAGGKPNEALLRSSVPDGQTSYIERSWDSENQKVVSTTKILTEEIGLNDTPTSETQYKRLKNSPGSYLDLGTEDSELHEYYVVSDEEVNFESLIVQGPNVHIILCDKAWLHLNSAVGVERGDPEKVNTVYFHAQSSGSTMGKLTSGSIGGSQASNGANIEIHGGNFDLQGNTGCAAIGGQYDNNGNITIYDGKIKAIGGDDAAGIGGGYMCSDYGNITIYGGSIDATGSAGIGGGSSCENGKLTIWDGAITAHGQGESAGIGSNQYSGDYGAGTITINGGYVRAYGDDYGAGIGGGDGIRGGTLNVNGGRVDAYGGTDAAGIGGGEGGNGGIVNVNGGYVYAVGKDNGAGIGGGQDGVGANVTINGGTVIAKAGLDETGCRAIGPGEGCDNYGSLTIGDNMMVSSERMANAQERKGMCWYRTQVRVDPCTHKDATYTVSGTTAEDTHKRQCSYCSDHTTEKHTFENGKCTVCGVGATAYDVRIYLPKDQGGSYDGKTYSSQTIQMGLDNNFTMPSSPTTIPGLEFKGWEVSSVTDDTYTSTYTTTDGGDILKTGDEYTITGNVSFIARYQTLDISLSDNADNSLKLLQYNGKTANSVTLSGRTFIKDDKWNTLCLPFALSAEEIAASPLAGCTLKELDVDAGSYEHITGFEDGKLYLNFKSAESIEAGKAYLIKWASDSNIENPTFSNVTINNVLYGVRSKDKTIAFGGTYNTRTFTEENRSILFLGGDNKLYYPIGTEPVNINAFRAYFQLKGIKTGDVSETKMFFGVDYEDGINTIKNEKRKDKNDIYNLSGQRLSKLQKGVNLVNGRKVLF